MLNKARKTILPNGIRVLTLPIKSRRGVAAGVWIDAGSRDDPLGQEGLCHLTEHMSFKGTPTRSALDIARELESVAASENGYTSQEETCYYIYLPAEQLHKGMNILGDMVSHASVDNKLFLKELSVVASEMSDVADTPSEIARDHFTSVVFGDHPLGKTILGYPMTVNNLCRDDVLEFINTNYVAPRIIVAAVGNIDHDYFCELTEKNFDIGTQASQKSRTSPKAMDYGKFRVVEKKTSQLSIYLGGRAFSFVDPMRYQMAILDIILGRGASSLLFHCLREEEGIGYRIFSFEEYFGDCGLWGIYASIDPKSIERFFQTVDSVFNKIIAGTAVAERFDETLRGVTGRIALENDSVGSLLARLVETELYLGRFISPDMTLAELSKITPEDIVELARSILDRDRISGVCYGPSKKLKIPCWLTPVKEK
ncbi:insulinase family protein [bacterium]|nr:insulinase family protein [bacterium]